MTRTACHLCGAATGDGASLCSTCTRDLTRDLRAVRTLAELLPDTYARRSRIGSGSSGGSRPTERPLPWDNRAAVVGRSLDGTVHRWATWWTQNRPGSITIRTAPLAYGPLCQPAASDVAPTPSRPSVGTGDGVSAGKRTRRRERAGRPGRAAGCDHESCHELATGDTLDVAVQLANHLARDLAWIRQQPAAPVMAEQLRSCTSRAWAIVDRPPDTQYVGLCDEPAPTPDDRRARCLGPLYAEPGADWVTCPRCGVQWDVARRRAWLLRESRETLATAAVIARGLTAFGVELRAARIWQWRSRGQLIQRGVDVDGRTPTYRVGDVQDLLAAAEAYAARRAARG